MPYSWMLPVIVFLPLLSAALLAYKRNTWSKGLIGSIASGSVFVSFAATLVALAGYVTTGQPVTQPLFNWGPLGELGFLGDSLSLWWSLVVTGCGFLITLYAVGYMHDDESFGRFMAKMNFFIYAMSMLVLSDNYATMLWGWANVGLASYMLIGFYIKKPEATSANMKAFVMNMIGEAGMITGIAAIVFVFGSVKFDVIFPAAASVDPGVLTLIALLLLAGAVAKSAQFPLHTWLPYAMEGPTPVSALIHAATMVTAGVYVVARSYPLYHGSETASLVVASVGAIGALMGAIIASGQFDIKRVLAFSTLSQIGFMFLGNGVGAYSAASFHFFTHAFFKAALFLCAGIIIHDMNGEQDIRKMGGVKEKNPFAYWTFLVSTAALVGVPFITSGFYSKDEILAEALAKSPFLFGIGFLAAGLTAFYNMRLFSLVFWGNAYLPPVAFSKKKRREILDAHDDHHHTPLSMKLPVAILSVLGVAAGWIAIPGMTQVVHDFLGGYFAQYGAPQTLHDHFAWGLIASVSAIMALGLGLGYWLYGPNGVRRERELDLTRAPGARARMLYFDEIYDYLIVQPVLSLSNFVSQSLDTGLVDGIVNGAARVAGSIGASVTALHTGYIRRYALTLFTGLVAIVAYFIYYA